MLDKKYYLYGMARSGMATMRAILKAGGQVICGDDSDLSTRTDIPESCVKNPISCPPDAEAVILAPAIPLTHPAPHAVVLESQKQQKPIWCDIELFYRTYRSYKNVRWIAVTGTNGKSTVTALTAYLLQQLGKKAFACGNIGTAIFDVPTPDQFPSTEEIYYVIEISSYQADLCHDFRPDAVAFLNLTPDHLDRHGNEEGYFQAKMRLLKYIPFHGKAVFPHVDDFTKRAAMMAKNTFEANDHERNVIREAIGKNLSLQGEHNYENALAAFGLLRILGIEADKIYPLFAGYVGLPHRCEYIGKKANVIFVNDSKATNAEATEKALLSYENIYWLAGGVAKADGIEPLILCLEYVNHAFIYGQDQKKFADTLRKTKKEFSSYYSLQDALHAAWEMASQDSEDAVILLSPAAASFDAFKNFEHRGDMFRAYIQDLK